MLGYCMKIKMPGLVLVVGFACVAANAVAISQVRPFVLPIAARVSDESMDGKGWQERGVVTVPYVQAEGNFRSSMNQSGWGFLHKVSLGGRNGRALYTWRKGRRELTLMLWRIDVNRTGFSWGMADNGRKEK